MHGWASSAGTTSAEILKVGVGARAIAMGEASTALTDDVNSLYWNPAGLALMPRGQASFTYFPVPLSNTAPLAGADETPSERAEAKV